MSELKLTQSHLKYYLDTRISLIPNEFPDSELPLESINYDAVMGSDEDGNEGEFYYQDIKLMCYRLSDLDKLIPELGIVPLEQLTPYAKTRITFVRDCGEDLRDWTFQDMQKLFQWHFWVFDQEYFEAGLVIDKLKAGKEATRA